uniref:alpha-1,2-Mannosidase n=1 Tax=Amorphochlora amoebiformis TaxID=1561963 RepID=A0A7S0H8D7_9EUKA|mmetsp:Transcript_5723/g.8783  ORF Transcript_5723/g.8783 Transcript_5723/m.8783 type:complete len:1001 (+) Transcript_5723:2-3004(+)
MTKITQNRLGDLKAAATDDEDNSDEDVPLDGVFRATFSNPTSSPTVANSSNNKSTRSSKSKPGFTSSIYGSSRRPPPDSPGLTGGGWLTPKDLHKGWNNGKESEVVAMGYVGAGEVGTSVTLKLPMTLSPGECAMLQPSVTFQVGGSVQPPPRGSLAFQVYMSMDGHSFVPLKDILEISEEELVTPEPLAIVGDPEDIDQLFQSSIIQADSPFSGDEGDPNSLGFYLKFEVTKTSKPVRPAYFLSLTARIEFRANCPTPLTVVAATTPLADPTKGPRTYAGCFSKCDLCALQVDGNEDVGMTVDYCEIMCRNQGAKVMETVGGDTCRCAFDMGAAVPEDRTQLNENSCNLLCSGDSDMLCGGRDAANVYAITEESSDFFIRRSMEMVGRNGGDKIILKMEGSEEEELVNLKGSNMQDFLHKIQKALKDLTKGTAQGGIMLKAGGLHFELNANSLATLPGTQRVIDSELLVPADSGLDPVDDIDTWQPAGSQFHSYSLKDRREQIKAEFKWAWDAYTKYAWGHDDVKPLSKSFEDNYGMALTMVDSLDTLYIMGFKEEFEKCVKWIGENLEFKEQKDINLFETTIRVLGGLLGAYTLSNEKILLDKATELGDAMLFAFETNTGIPYGTLDLKNKKGHNPEWTQGYSTVAEVGSIQMEFRLLSRLTGNPVYKEKTDRALNWLKKSLDSRGLFTQFISPEAGQMKQGVVTLGARVDSVYEYFLKLWVMAKGKDMEARELYERSIKLILSELALKSNATGLTFIAEKSGNSLLGKMDHLVCFLPGIMALDHSYRAHLSKITQKSPKLKEGKKTFLPPFFSFPVATPDTSMDVDSKEFSPYERTRTITVEKYLQIAEELGKTCFEFYRRSPSGVAPEIVQFRPGEMDFVIDPGAAHSLLRPEAVESFYHIYKATGDTKWQLMSWKVFLALKKWARVDSGGYANIKDVRITNPEIQDNQDDRMESFFLSETMKYLFLVLEDEGSDQIPLESFVFNTEAHAFLISDD